MFIYFLIAIIAIWGMMGLGITLGWLVSQILNWWSGPRPRARS